MYILVFNAGSSSLKFTLVRADDLHEVGSGIVDWKADLNQAEVNFRSGSQPSSSRQVSIRNFHEAVAEVARLVAEHLGGQGKSASIVACGHRIVHGGTHFRGSTLIDAGVKNVLTRLSDLAPLHNPPALEVLAAAEQRLPGIPHVAVFDTAFFADLPEVAFLYPVPYSWHTAWGIRRFGFHGISHHYCSLRVAEFFPANTDLRLVICHLGNGCSASAVRAGRAVTTTMGFTPLEGLMMGTRSGSIDPGILLHLLHKGLLDVDELDEALQRKSGLLGVSGISGDVRLLEAAAAQGQDRARLALTMFADRVRATIGALAVTLGGIDALVFTAGIGEHASRLRAEICRGLECLGIDLDAELNAHAFADTDVASRPSQTRILVLHTREEHLIASETQRLTNV